MVHVSPQNISFHNHWLAVEPTWGAETNPTQLDPTKNCLLLLNTLLILAAIYNTNRKLSNPVRVWLWWRTCMTYQIFRILLDNIDGPFRQTASVMFADKYRTTFFRPKTKTIKLPCFLQKLIIKVGRVKYKVVLYQIKIK